MKISGIKDNYNSGLKRTSGKYCHLNPGPYELVLEKGEQALTDAQLLAVILRTGRQGADAVDLARSIFEACSQKKGLTGLFDISIEELMAIKGIGKVKAIQIRCIVELSTRISKERARDILNFNSSSSIANYYMEDMRHLDKERVMLVLLDSKNRLIKDMVLSVGAVNKSLLSPREVFIEVLRYKAVSFVLIHNHPSGDPSPSKDDIIITQRIAKGANILGIRLLDHIIIGDKSYKSLYEEELINF